jgi:DNA-nicking Smr family endonuclease
LTNWNDIVTLESANLWLKKFWWRQVMKPPKSSGFFKPFKNLDILLEGREIRPQPAPILEIGESRRSKLDHRQEQKLFDDAMADVRRIPRGNCPAIVRPEPRPPGIGSDADDESLQELNNLVNKGAGFAVSLTPEYIEGIDNTVNPTIARRLHRGDFSIQAHIDLHGQSVLAARETFDRFLHNSVVAGKNALLVIHGRGLSSPAGPVLKLKVVQWLTASPWRKWVVAFTSARLCDGGAGATYVLLRQRPAKKRKKRNC